MNFMFIPVLVQLVQVVLFTALLFAFFVAFGALSIHDNLVASWTSKPAIPIDVLGLKLPIDLTLMKVSLILAAFSGLAFAASAETDARYEALFAAPVFNEMRTNLTARAAYKHSLEVDPDAAFDPITSLRTHVEDTATVLGVPVSTKPKGTKAVTPDEPIDEEIRD